MAKRIIFGGTFDPVHRGHLALCAGALEQTGAQGVLLIPSFLPPHKTGAAVSGEHRLAMCKLAAETSKIPIEVSDMEIARGGESYTVETLRVIQAAYPQDRLYFLCGADMAVTLFHWKEYRAILKLAVILAAPRDDLNAQKMLETKRQMENDGGYMEILDLPMLDVSSSVIREKIKNGEDFSADIPSAVAAYIQKSKLYV